MQSTRAFAKRPGGRPRSTSPSFNAAVEDKDDVEPPEEELEKMKVIGDLWTFLEQKTAERLEA